MAVLAPEVWYRDLQLYSRLAWHCEYRRVGGGFDARSLGGDSENCLRGSWMEMGNEEYDDGFTCDETRLGAVGCNLEDYPVYVRRVGPI